MSSTYHQPVLPISQPIAFRAVSDAIAAAFSAAGVKGFLKSVERSGLRVRSFESVLAAGLLGSGSKAEYDKLGGSDQGQIRELYLASLERVEPEVRQRFFKLYAYY